MSKPQEPRTQTIRPPKAWPKTGTSITISSEQAGEILEAITGTTHDPMPVEASQAPAAVELMPVVDQTSEDPTQEETPEPEKPELIMLPSLVNVVVEDGSPQVFCAFTGRKFVGWSDIKTDMKKGTVTLTLKVEFETIETIKTPPKPKEDKQLEIPFEEPAPATEPVQEEPAHDPNTTL